MTLTPDQLDKTVARYLELDARRNEIVAEQDQIKIALRTQLEPGRHDTPSGQKVTISPNRRFNADLAQSVIPAELLPLVMTETIDSKKAKAVLPPALYNQCSAEVGEPRVSIA